MDIESKFKDLDVPEGIKEVADTPSTLPMPGNTQNELNSKIMASTIAELVGQKKFLGVSEVNTTQAGSNHIRTIAFSYDYIQNHISDELKAVAPIFYKGFRCDLKVTVEVTSVFQQQGAASVNVINMPSTLYNAMFRNQTRLQNTTKLPRSFITWGHCGTYTYTLPWQSNMEYWPMKQWANETYYQVESNYNNGYMDNGRIIFRVFDQLRIAENVTPTVVLRFWTQLDNLRFFVYQPNEFR